MRRKGDFQEEGVLRQASREAQEAASGLRKSEGSARASPGSTQATFPDQRPEPARKGFICYAERDGRNRQQR
jgi:hypothetical protein